jgi:hypothetical protein
MNDHRTIVADTEQTLAVLAAELTAAAYPVALRHAVGDRWLDLQIELWRVLSETVKKWGSACREPDDPLVAPFKSQ